uniref:Leishmanolysin-like peptidase n=1 Tax=Syphacia muris TaxID=451379 RepID=A0A0N5AGU5_9BILA
MNSNFFVCVSSSKTIAILQYPAFHNILLYLIAKLFASITKHRFIYIYHCLCYRLQSCFQLKPEYDDNCLSALTANDTQEIVAFCAAYLTMCKDIMDSRHFYVFNRPNYSAYCSVNLERFEYVCPEPFRFGKYTEQATKFCERYMSRCPSNQVPHKPVYFKKEKHIYIREVEYICSSLKNFASTYCIRPTVLKVMKYLMICGFYKQKCIDVYSTVIYA